MTSQLFCNHYIVVSIVKIWKRCPYWIKGCLHPIGTAFPHHYNQSWWVMMRKRREVTLADDSLEDRLMPGFTVGESLLLWHCAINLLVEEKYSRKLLQRVGLSKKNHCWVAQLTFWISTVSLGTWLYSNHLWPSLMWLYTEIDSVQPIRLKKENTNRLTITWYQSVKWNLLYSGRGSHQNTFDNGLRGLAVRLQTRKQVADKIAKDQPAPKDPANIRPV